MATWFLNGHDPKDPLVSPIYADFQGFPPLLIQAGTLETLMDDTLRLADRAKEGGVDVTVQITEDAPHCWHFFSSFLPEGVEAVGRVADYVNQHTHD
jgi:acetyl esterase/lipase